MGREVYQIIHLSEPNIVVSILGLNNLNEVLDLFYKLDFIAAPNI
jgi:hypothetical protein